MNVLYCAICGAANTETDTICFACGNALLHSQDFDEPTQMQTITILEGRYRLIDRVGKGGFATVYKAEDLHTKRIVAIKEITLKKLKPQEIIDATDTYHREIRFGTLLKHPSLPEVYANFMDPEHWYIVAEFIDGQTLEDYRQQLPAGLLSLQEGLSIALQVCDVLSYLHSRQPPIIFRDIKPDNIMRTRTGHIYLIDFGIARQFRPGQRRDTQTLGSPGYAAPEQYGSAQTTERSDIYSLGATLQALLTGQDPLDADVATAPTKKPVTLPAELSALLANMLAKDPAQRPTSITEVKRRLEKISSTVGDTWLTAQSPVIPPPPPPPPSTPYYVPSNAANVKNPASQPKKLPAWLKVVAIATILLLVTGFGNVALSTFPHFSLWQHVEINTGPPVMLDRVPADQQVLNIAMNSATQEPLDPATVQYTQSMQIVSMTSAGLVSFNDRMEIVPQLAQSWETSSDGYTWTFHLRPNLKFSDGASLTATDVAYSLDRALDPALKYGTAPYNLQYIQGADQRVSGKIKTLIGQSILTPDDNTLVIKLSKNIAYFLDTLTCPCASVVEKSLIDKYSQSFTDHLSEGGSSGPFEFSPGTKQKIELVPNPFYYGSKPTLTKISFTSYVDTNTAYDSYRVAQVDFVDNIPASMIDKVDQNTDFHQSLQLSTTYYAMNYLTKPFDNIKIRQAFALAINKDLISQKIRNNTVLPTNHIIPQGDPSANTSLSGPAGVTTTAGDPVLAKKLLQEGMQEEGISSMQAFPSVTLTYYKSSSVAVQNEITAMQAMWKTNLGLNIKLQAMPASTFYNKVSNSNDARNIQMWRIGWIADYPDASDWTTLQFGQGAAQNTYAYGQNQSKAAAHQQEIQRSLARADVTQNQAQRISMYRNAEQDLVNDVAWLPLYQSYDYYVVKAKLHGLNVNAMGMIAPEDWSSIYVTQ
ncbi:ABC transporter substrate-binding protein [Dictyobacter kobayashii]|nr:ABC transporter substrate-binding protein [Dictyobacter kobayashii]